MSSSSSGGMGLASVVQIIFIVLKLVKVINWSWLWVLSPTWISVLLAILLVVIYTILDSV